MKIVELNFPSRHDAHKFHQLMKRAMEQTKKSRWRAKIGIESATGWIALCDQSRCDPCEDATFDLRLGVVKLLDVPVIDVT